MAGEQMLLIGLSASGMALFFGLGMLAWRFESKRALAPPAPAHGSPLDAATEFLPKQELFSECVARVEAAYWLADTEFIPKDELFGSPEQVAPTLPPSAPSESPNIGDTEILARDEALDRALDVLARGRQQLVSSLNCPSRSQ